MQNYSVVIVAHDYTRNLLSTLLALRQHAQPGQVIVVDNASTADIRGVIRLSQLPAQHIRLTEHQSLGAAFNTGIDAAGHDMIVLLHSDVVLESDPADAVRYLRDNPDVGVVGAKLFKYEAEPRHVLHAGYSVGRGRIGPTPIGRNEWDRYHETIDVAAVSDACMVVRCTPQRFDERYWFRLQDVDLCYQYQQQGLRAVFLPSFQAVHYENGGVLERRADLVWAARQLASQLLYHERWCSDLTLAEHPLQQPVLGEAARQYHDDIDMSYGVRTSQASATSGSPAA